IDAAQQHCQADQVLHLGQLLGSALFVVAAAPELGRLLVFIGNEHRSMAARAPGHDASDAAALFAGGLGWPLAPDSSMVAPLPMSLIIHQMTFMPRSYRVY